MAIEITLKHPFKSDTGVTIEKITMQRGTRKDLKDASRHSKDDVEQEDFLFHRLTGLTMEDLDRLDLEDNAALQAAFKGMVGQTKSQ